MNTTTLALTPPNSGSDNSGSKEDSAHNGNNNDKNPKNKQPQSNDDPLLCDKDSHLQSNTQIFYLGGNNMVQFVDAMYKFYARAFIKKGPHSL